MNQTFKWAVLATSLSLVPLASQADTADGKSLIGKSWDDVTAMARGGEVNWFLWGVLDKGSVDMIWVNGENFRTMKQGDLAFCGYLETLPNNELVDWDNPSIANDFGVPVDGCEVPWSKTQFAFAYDNFNGSVFVRHVFYHAAGGVDKLLGEFDQATYDEVAEKTWDILNDLEPSLWRDGKTYPTSVAAMEQLYANSEVDLTFNYEPAGVGLKIEDGTFPPTTQGYGLTDGTIGNTNYTIIPFNSPNKAAALVLQNVLLSGEAQLQKALPDVWGAKTAIEISRTSDDVQAKFGEIKAHPNVVPAAELAKAALPELQASWISAIEKGWVENVGK